MKSLPLIFTIFSCLSCSALASPRIEKGLAAFDEEPTPENLERLSIYLIGLVRYNEVPEDHPYYHELQKRFMSEPANIRYFETKLLEAYQAYRYPDSPEHQGAAWTRYNDSMLKAFRTWINLPSPETVDILCGMLGETWYRKYEDSYYVLKPLGERATHALSHLGIEGAPSEPLALIAGVAFPERERWLEWWAEVESGERLLAFEGQPVAFRRQTDGTWETQSRDVTGESPGASTTGEDGAAVDPVLAKPGDVDATEAAERRSPNWLGWGVLLVILGLVVGLGFRVFRRVGKRS